MKRKENGVREAEEGYEMKEMRDEEESIRKTMTKKGKIETGEKRN